MSMEVPFVMQLSCFHKDFWLFQLEPNNRCIHQLDPGQQMSQPLIDFRVVEADLTHINRFSHKDASYQHLGSYLSLVISKTDENIS